MHERLCQSANAEEVKKTSDIVEQLKYLLEGARSQKIVVNIDVRSQASLERLFFLNSSRFQSLGDGIHIRRVLFKDLGVIVDSKFNLNERTNFVTREACKLTEEFKGAKTIIFLFLLFS